MWEIAANLVHLVWHTENNLFFLCYCLKNTDLPHGTFLTRHNRTPHFVGEALKRNVGSPLQIPGDAARLDPVTEPGLRDGLGVR